jgi:hypothetical protein
VVMVNPVDHRETLMRPVEDGVHARAS